MTDTTTNHATNDTGGQRDYDQVLADAVAVLSEAARRTTTRGRGTSSEQQDQADFADFLATALAGTAANLGGIEPLLAGRSGSWEADYVRQLLVGTVGEDERYLWEHRTDPLVIRVHADDILTDLGYWALYDDAQDELNRREAAVHARHDPSECVEDYGAQDLAEHDLICELHDALDRQREQDCAAYGRAFAEQVHGPRPPSCSRPAGAGRGDRRTRLAERPRRGHLVDRPGVADLGDRPAEHAAARLRYPRCGTTRCLSMWPRSNATPAAPRWPASTRRQGSRDDRNHDTHRPRVAGPGGAVDAARRRDGLHRHRDEAGRDPRRRRHDGLDRPGPSSPRCWTRRRCGSSCAACCPGGCGPSPPPRWRRCRTGSARTRSRPAA